MLVKDVMKKNVISAQQQTSVRDIACILCDNRVGCVIIKNNEGVVGIVTDRDVLTEIAKNRVDMDSTPVERIMTRYVIQISSEATLEKAAETMAKNNIKKLPVTEGVELVGIITTTDICAAEPMLMHEYRKRMQKTSQM